MSDPYLLRDERGHPLTSIFHEVPFKSEEYPIYEGLFKLFNLTFPPIEDFHPDDMKGDEEE